MSDVADGPLGRAQAALTSWRRQRAATREGRRRGRRFTALTRLILALNLIALVFFIGGALYINFERVSLIDERILSLKTQGAIIAGALAESATSGPEATAIDRDLAVPLLRRLVGPTNTRARLFDETGRLQLDSRQLLPSNRVETYRLPAPDESVFSFAVFERIYDWMANFVPAGDYPPYEELRGGDGTVYGEVVAALRAESASAVRVNSTGELILSVAVPVQRYQLVLGVLMLSTEGGDIGAIIRAERLALLELALVALAVMVISSLALARAIARPVKALADAADRVRSASTGREEIPDFTQRHDEIGDLSASLRDMTGALYNRIDAIEQFAADVAHEIKNPLTSLKSAVDTMGRAPDGAAQERLKKVIVADVQRINRLVQDISDASRLDAELSRARHGPVDLHALVNAVAEVSNDPDKPDRPVVSVETEEGTLERGEFIVPGLDGPLGQVFGNLVENARSFSPPGGRVRILLRRDGNQAVVTVEDDGPGIPPENFETIFQRFYTSRPESHGFGRNSGLGLSISKQIVDVHGGTITATNRRDPATGRIAGARFTVRLPVNAS